MQNLAFATFFRVLFQLRANSRLTTLCPAFILYSESLSRRTLCRLRLPENSDCTRCMSYCAGNCTPHVKGRHYLADKEEFDFILRIFLEKFREHFQKRVLCWIFSRRDRISVRSFVNVLFFLFFFFVIRIVT